MNVLNLITQLLPVGEQIASVFIHNPNSQHQFSVIVGTVNALEPVLAGLGEAIAAKAALIAERWQLKAFLKSLPDEEPERKRYGDGEQKLKCRAYAYPYFGAKQTPRLLNSFLRRGTLSLGEAALNVCRTALQRSDQFLSAAPVRNQDRCGVRAASRLLQLAAKLRGHL
jgi:hypothetical protein